MSSAAAPLRLGKGSRFALNVATSAAGEVRCEVQEQDGRPIPGFSLADSVPVIGDELARPVRWNGGGDLAALAGRPIRLRCVLTEADLYALRILGAP